MMRSATHIGYYRHGEALLLLEPAPDHPDAAVTRREVERLVSADQRPPLAEDDRASIARWLAQVAGVDLLTDRNTGSAAVSAFQGPDGALRPVLSMVRAAGAFVLQPVNLASWIPRPLRETDRGRLNEAVAGVARAVAAINQRLAGRPVQPDGSRFRIVGAAPRWYALAFNG